MPPGSPPLPTLTPPSLSLGRPEVVANLIRPMIEWAREGGAHAIVTACPMCLANLRDIKKFEVRTGESILDSAFNGSTKSGTGREKRLPASERR